MEDFPTVPVEMVKMRGPCTDLGRLQRHTVIRHQPLAETDGAIRFLRNTELKFVIDCESTTVKQFMMHAAKGETVGFVIGTPGLMPFDVRRFESDLL